MLFWGLIMARKKGDIALVGILAVLVLYPLIKFLEWVGSFWLFIVMLAGAVVAVLLVLLRTILPPAQASTKQHRPIAPPEVKPATQAEGIDFDRLNRPPTEEEIVADGWEFWTRKTQDAIRCGSVDEIRFGLQKLAYVVSRKSVSAETKEEFRQCVAEFAKVDPLYPSVVSKMRLLLVDNPGLQQSHIYKGQSDKIIEQMRYVLYYAEVLGDLVRVKKGSSYLLYLPEQRDFAEKTNQALAAARNKRRKLPQARSDSAE